LLRRKRIFTESVVMKRIQRTFPLRPRPDLAVQSKSQVDTVIRRIPTIRMIYKLLLNTTN